MSRGRLDPGYVVTDEDVERARQRLAELPPISDEQHARNLEWLRQFDDERTAAPVMCRVGSGRTRRVGA